VLGLLGVRPTDLGAQKAKSSGVTGELSPPTEIEGLDARPVVPLEFSRAWLGKAAKVRQRRAELMAAGELDGVAPAALKELGAALSGVLRVPVIPVHYADVRPPFDPSALADRLFGPARGDTMSYSAYWREVSGGLLEVEGEVAPWVRLPRPAKHYLPRDQYAWASFGRIAELRREALEAADRVIDFGAYDNDGPDGVPNSGDDDGFVDFVAIVYATRCDGDWREGAIWPHRGAMEPFETSDPAAGGGRIRIADYVILPAFEQGTCDPMHIGVLAHETGHALGLPDLYDYDGSSQGIGAWGLMGMGSHNARHSPAHLSAWSKEQLGWVAVEWLGPDRTELELPPVNERPVVLRYDLPGVGGEYLLFENRQRLGSDAHLPGSGLLAWRINPDRGELGAWNADERHRAVDLIQADGREDLSRGRGADAGDPFPGETRRDVFELGGARPLRLTGITEQGGVIRAAVEVGYSSPALVAADERVRFSVVPGDPAVSRLVEVRREGGASGAWSPSATASWLRVHRKGEVLVVRADPSGLAPGTYTDTVSLALDGADSPVGRVEVELEVVAADAPEVIARDLPWGWGLAVRSGRIFQASYGWDPLALRPRPRLLRLPDGETHAETLVRLPAEAVYAPVVGTRDIFVLAQAQDDNLLYRVRPDGGAQVVASGLGPAPAYGAAPLRDGSILVADWTGRVQRIAPDGSVHPWTQFGANLYQIATDSLGNLFAAAYDGHVLRLGVDGAFTRIPTGFAPGRLVAIAATPAGEVFAAERGGEGRIVRITAAGDIVDVGRVAGAEFYGLAVDERFLYALDLHNRQLLRFALPADGTVAAAP